MSTNSTIDFSNKFPYMENNDSSLSSPTVGQIAHQTICVFCIKRTTKIHRSCNAYKPVASLYFTLARHMYNTILFRILCTADELDT